MCDEPESGLDALPPPPASLLPPADYWLRHRLPSLPGFEMLCELGRGGMGRVFKARHQKLKRLVAVKMLSTAEFAEAEEREQFLKEAQALASLQHRHIVQIFEVGEYRDRPFLVMECLDGGSLEKYLRGQSLDPLVAAAVLETLAHAVDYVHHRGLLHRDLKLANILIDSDPEKPLDPDKVKLTDFGLAKRLAGDRTGNLPSITIAGTPNYMAPEQAVGQPATPASDVYSLGAILYELITGRPPFVGPTWMDTLSQVIGSEPATPRRLVQSLPRDLETICQKCLRKNPSQRYCSAGQLADDLKRFRNGLPILARPVGLIERISKWARRRPAIAALCVTLATSVLIGVTLVTWKWQEALSANAAAEHNHRNEIEALGLLAEEQIQGEVLRREAAVNRIRAYASLIAQVDRAWQMGSMDRCQELLSQCPADLRNWEWHYLHNRLHAGQSVIRASDFKARQVAFQSNGKLMASAGGELEDVSQDGVIKIWDPNSSALLFELSGEHKGPVTWLTFHPNNQWLISLSLRLDWRRVQQGDVNAFDDAQGECVLWDLDQRKSLLKIPGLFDVGALSSDGSLFAAAGSDHQMRIWRLGAQVPWQEVAKLPRYKGVTKKLAFSPDGTMLARSGTQIEGVERGELKFTPELKLWRCDDGSEVRALPIPHVEIEALAFSPDGQSLAWSNGPENTFTLWDLQSNRALRSFYGHKAPIQSIDFSRDGSALATGGQDRLVKIWDVATGGDLRTLRGHDVSVESVAFGPESVSAGRRLASAGGDGTVRFWDPETGQEPRSLSGHPLAITQAIFSPDGYLIASRSAGGVIRIWNAATGHVLFEMTCGAEHLAWSPNSKWLLSGGGDHRAAEKPGELIVWDAATGKQVRQLDGHQRFVLAVAWSSDGSHFISIDGNPWSPAKSGELILWNGETFAKEKVWTPPTGCILDLAFGGDGTLVAAAGFDKKVYLFEPARGNVLRTLSGHEQSVTRVVFSHNSARIASGDAAGVARIWNIATGKTEQVLRAAMNPIGGLCFNSKGDRLATASVDFAYRDSGTAILWDVSSGQEMIRLSGQQTVHFSPDDRYLAVASPGNLVQPGSVLVLDATPDSALKTDK